MNLTEIFIAIIILTLVVLSVRSIRKNVNKDGCAGCSSCGSGCSHKRDHSSDLSPLNQNKNTTHNTQ